MANDFKRMWTKEELNQFLQRRLDEPSKTYNLGVSHTDSVFVENITENDVKEGQFVALWLNTYEDTNPYAFYGIVTNVENRNIWFNCLVTKWTDANDNLYHVFQVIISLDSIYPNISIESITSDEYYEIKSRDLRLINTLKFEVF